MKKEKKIKGQYRQGDVLIQEVPLDSIDLSQATEEPRDEYGRIVLAHGESTGHSHTVREEQVKIFNLNGVRYLYDPTGQGFTLRHELVGGQPTGDHGWIEVKAKAAKLFRIGGKAGHQKEYSPAELRNVAD